MSVYNIFNMASGEELGRYFARTLADALDAMARTAGFEDYALLVDGLTRVQPDRVAADALAFMLWRMGDPR